MSHLPAGGPLSCFSGQKLGLKFIVACFTKKEDLFSAKLGCEMSRILLKCFNCSQEERIVIWEIIRERSSHYTCSALSVWSHISIQKKVGTAKMAFFPVPFTCCDVREFLAKSIFFRECLPRTCLSVLAARLTSRR